MDWVTIGLTPLDTRGFFDLITQSPLNRPKRENFSEKLKKKEEKIMKHAISWFYDICPYNICPETFEGFFGPLA
jgi:hypothetical protein